MTRSEFFKRTFAGVLAAVGLSKAKAEPKTPVAFEWEGYPMFSRVKIVPINRKGQRVGNCRIRDTYTINDGGIHFEKGMFRTSDPDLIKALFNHPACKK